MTVAAQVELVGREEELRRLRQFVDAVPMGPAGVVIQGEVGIGKTVLWRAGVEAAAAGGIRVLTTRCVEAEMPLAFGGLADLLDEVFADIAGELPPPQRAGLAVALGLEAPATAAPDTIALPRALTAAVRALADQAPLLIAVDDVQWLDVASRRILSFAVRRLGDAPVGVLLARRGTGGDPLGLAAGLPEGSVAQLSLGPLTIGALHHLVRSRLGVRIPRPLLAHVHEASGGNPMFALEFARSVADRAGPGPLPVPASLEELVRARVRGYPDEIRPLLAVVAVVRRPTPRLLERVIENAGTLLDEAIAVDAVTLGRDAVVRFTHPLVSSAVYGELPLSRRRALHARLAHVVEDVEERAGHLALAAVEPDADVAFLLDEAAARARARGAPDAAADLAELAVRLTPPSHVADRERRGLAVAGYLADAGQAADARRQLERLLADGLSGARRAQALVIRFQVDSDFGPRSRTVDEALAHAGDDTALRARLLLVAAHRHVLREEFVPAEALARRAVAEAETVDDPALLATTLVELAYVTVVIGCPQPHLLERAMALADVHGVLPRTVPPRVMLAGLRLANGDLTTSRELLEAEFEAIRRSGREFDRRGCLLELVELELSAGNWAVAERYLDEVWELVFDGGDRRSAELVEHARALLAAHRGRVDETRRLVEQTLARGEPLCWPYLAALNRWALGFLELSLGEPGRAWELLADVVERLDSKRVLRGGTRLAIANAVEALVFLGRCDEADAILARFDAHRRPEDLWAAGVALRGRALLLLARGEWAAAREAAAQSAAGFETAGFPFDCGRSLLTAGEAMRRLGERRQAAVDLEKARSIFAKLGAALWLGRAERELRRANPRPRRDRDLTNAERRVAALVAEGRTNREVAAQLFTTVGTVEVHLTRIYRKLGIRSRTDLARLVADGTLDLADA